MRVIVVDDEGEVDGEESLDGCNDVAIAVAPDLGVDLIN